MKPILEDATQKCRKTINDGILDLLAAWKKFEATHPGKLRTLARIRWNFDEDAAGQNAIFFRVVLTDKAAQEQLLKASQELQAALMRYCKLDWFILKAYFEFRSEAEQKTLKSPEWE